MSHVRVQYTYMQSQLAQFFNFSISNIDKGDIAHMLDNKEKYI